MPGTSLSDLNSIGPSLKAYKFDLSFPVLPSAVSIGAPGREIHLRCQTIDLPKKTGETIMLNMHGHELPEPGIYKPSGTISITLLETVDVVVLKLIKDLRDLVWAPDTGRSEEIEANSLEILLQHLDTNDGPLWFYRLKRCFLEDYDLPALDGSASDSFKPSMTIRYTDFEDGRV